LTETLNAALLEHLPELHATLQPGIRAPWSTPKDVATWFQWRNGQPRDTDQTINDTYRFVSFDDARAELRHMRATVWKSPLNAVILAALARRSFYSLPILTDIAGDGYCYNLLSRKMYHRFKGERDIYLNSFDAFVELLVKLVSCPAMSPGSAAEFEYGLLEQYS
jgi:hypothetical protein